MISVVNPAILLTGILFWQSLSKADVALALTGFGRMVFKGRVNYGM
ncbi:hypothetical protein MCAMS1_01991 [biofilm metagenome]